MTYKTLLRRVATAAVLIGLVLLCAYLGTPFPEIGIFIVAAICLTEWLLIFVKQAKPGQKITESRLFWGVLGAVYIVLACWGGLYLYQSFPMGVSLWLLGSVWAVDTCAFGVGYALGGPKLAPTISPLKTWSGALGGVAGAVLVTLAFQLAGFIPGGLAMLLMHGVALAVIAILGDLLESAAKRKLGVKDASGLLPGHGGLLDRVDALLAVWLVGALLVIAVGGAA